MGSSLAFESESLMNQDLYYDFDTQEVQADISQS